MGFSAGLSAFRLAFELSPIILQDGVAKGIPGGFLPVIAITQGFFGDISIGGVTVPSAVVTAGTTIAGALLSGSSGIEFDDFFAHFVPSPGASLYRQIIGKYPFANQAVAANAVIQQPTNVSLRMICPAKPPGGYANKLAIMTALQGVIKKHNSSGGTYIVATPSFIYTNCVYLDLTDVSRTDDVQAQNTWQWDFEAPLLTLQDVASAQSGLMSQLTAGTPLSGDPSVSGLGQAQGQPQSIAAPQPGVPASSTVTPTGNPGQQLLFGG